MLCLCDRAPGSKIDEFKEFTKIIRKKELEEVILLIDDNSTKNLKEYIQLLLNVKLIDTQFHIYYGEVKLIVNYFLTFYTAIIDDIIKAADAYSNAAMKDDLIILIEKTITTQQTKQDEFQKSFLPVTCLWEKEAYEEIEKEYQEYMKQLDDLKEFIYFRLDKQSKVDDFAKAHFPKVLKNLSEIFDITHLYTGILLTDNLRNTRLSLEDILKRLSQNLDRIRVDHGETISRLLDQLYEKNKESMSVARTDCSNSEALAEVTRGIDLIKSKIESYQLQVPVGSLETEVQYWATKLDYFNEIANNFTELKALKAQTADEQKKYHLLRCKQMPECKMRCRAEFRIAFSDRQEQIRLKLINEARALVTFYAVRGSDRIFYTDNIGPYYVDEYNHQNYFFDYGLRIYHLNCDGEFTSFPDYAYLFDKYGRYIEKDGAKLYQCAPCTSLYALNDANYLDKVTQDCGHSELANRKCRLDIRDPNEVAILPDIDPINIKQTLDSETVRYLWDSFGSVLPHALHDVGRVRPRNPIQLLAHKLIHHKYKRTHSEQEEKKKKAEQFRNDIFNKRKEKAEAASRLWKSKLVKRRKPEESDDAEFRAYVDARIAQDLFINALNMDL